MNTDGEPGTGSGERFGSYSPHRRSAVVLTGTGAHGAYHAGVLRALHEAGVKIDVLGGHGVGAASAALAAIDGGGRLWDADGVWRSGGAAGFYGWRRAVRAVAAAAAALLALLVITIVLLAVAVPYAGAVAAAALGLLAAGAGAVMWMTRGGEGRRTSGAWWWRLLGAPLDASAARDLFAAVVWQLIRGGAPEASPPAAVLGRRYCEVLLENLGQPGFRELLLVATDLDARRDVVGALIDERWRPVFLAHRADAERRSDVLDLSAAARDHAFDLVAAGLTPPVGCDPALVTFARDSFWRGETHRLCDRPGALHRLLDEVAAAGVTQVIIVSAVSRVEQPHRLRMPRLDMRSRLGEFQSAAEAAALRDALETAEHQFESVFVICPAHNPVGPYDVAGAYDEASDRRQELEEVIERAYEDAHRQFIEPVIGASGDQLAQSPAGAGGSAKAHGDRVLHDLGSTRPRDLD